jgi:hypothetical protein
VRQGGADGRTGLPGGALDGSIDAETSVAEKNAVLDLHSTTGEQGKNGELFPSQSTCLYWDFHLLKNGGVSVVLHGLLAISEGRSTGNGVKCHRKRAVAPDSPCTGGHR